MAGIADRVVEVDDGFEEAKFIGIELVYLVEYEFDGYSVGFGGGQESVYEGGGCLGVGNGDDE